MLGRRIPQQHRAVIRDDAGRVPAERHEPGVPDRKLPRPAVHDVERHGHDHRDADVDDDPRVVRSDCSRQHELNRRRDRDPGRQRPHAHPHRLAGAGHQTFSRYGEPNSPVGFTSRITIKQREHIHVAIVRRHVKRPELLDKCNHKPANHRPAHIADPADHRRHKRLESQQHPDRMRRLIQARILHHVQKSGRRRERRPQHKRKRHHAIDRNTHQRGRVGTVRHGPHRRAQLGVKHQVLERQHQRSRRPQDHRIHEPDHHRMPRRAAPERNPRQLPAGQAAPASSADCSRTRNRAAPHSAAAATRRSP